MGLSNLLHRLATTIFLCCLITLWWSACGSAPALPSPPPATAEPPLPAALAQQDDEQSLLQWIVIEREASIQGNLPLLAALWAEDARIVDGRGSASTSDDYLWQGRHAILDRYQLAVFPAPPPPLALDELAGATVTANGDSATLINGSDRWRFVHRDNRWWLQELVYSAP